MFKNEIKEDLIKQLDNVNIEFYKFKVKNIEFCNSWEKGDKNVKI